VIAVGAGAEACPTGAPLGPTAGASPWYSRGMRFVVVMVTVVAVALGSMASPAQAGAPIYIPPPTAPPPAPEPEKPPEPQRFRLLVLDLKAVDVDKNTVETLQGFVTTGLAQYQELDVISGADVKSMVELEANRATMGCSEDASCLADIADALGAQLVVFGNCGKLDDDLVINLNLFDSVKAQSLGRVVVQAPDAKQLAKKLRPKMHELVGRFYKERKLTLAPLPEEKPEPVAVAPSDPGPWPWVTVGTGVLFLAAGSAAAVVGYLPKLAYEDHKAQLARLEGSFDIDAPDQDTVAAAKDTHEQMRIEQTSWNNLGQYLFSGGVPVAAVGLVAVAGGLVWAASAPSAEPSEDAAPAAAPTTAAPTTAAPTTAAAPATGGAQ
jgi:hypothetical protein